MLRPSPPPHASKPIMNQCNLYSHNVSILQIIKGAWMSIAQRAEVRYYPRKNTSLTPWHYLRFYSQTRVMEQF